MKKFIKRIMSIGIISGLLLEAFPVWALSKDETIYAKLDNNGQVSKVIVTEHLKDTLNEKTNDKSKLENIENINGDEKYTKENNKLVWESNGKDIYYQGTTKEQLPVSLKITYFFNGKKSTIKDMLGKKGTIKIVLKYTNNDQKTVKVNGKNETLYTPFVVATTTIIPNTTNKNIEVTNGKVITNGTNSVVVLLSTPGLYESLKIDKLKDMDTATITYDTDNFALNSIYSVATPKLLESSDLEVFNNIDGLYDSIDKLASSSTKLKNGSSALLKGATTLKDGVNKLKDGINKAYSGSKQIRDILSYSLNNLKEDSSDALDNNTLEYIKTNAINGARDKINNTFTDEYKAAIGNQAVQAIKESSAYKGLLSKINELESAGISKQLVGICSGSEISDAYLETCINNKAYIETYATLLQMIQIMEETARQTAINTAIQTANTVSSETAKIVSTSVAVQVANKVKEEATKKTISSLEELLKGISDLTDGLNTINSKMADLDSGTKTLQDGITALDSGISQFNSQGINKILNVVNGDVKTLEGKIKALAKLSAEYNTFDDIENNTEGSSKIIMVVDAIKSNNSIVIKNDKISEESESLWDKVKKILK